ncbi:FAD-linked oxidoreductase [Rubrivivax gelatinosus]|uniref:D-arabinono-1,4-lactone oxidase n=2 Tax=Rubrivivax gelatinosus TaxID=28068 RepID=UPI0018C95F20|nr:D-arabinono-1,4-lactone oxidase [Rubrivivax gelatinosus]MBG6081070.1 FAD-linked oxidoreductase [Rubrivivax gelatinosus]
MNTLPPFTRRQVCASAAATVVAGWVAAAAAQTPTPARPATAPRWRNWSGLQQATPAAIATPGSETELQALLRAARGELRAVGSGHSFSALVPTPGTLVSLDRLSGLVSVDKAAGTATVRAGTRLAVLAQALDAQGLALRNLPDITMQTLAGALATGTHGTGATLPALHADVLALRLVGADGRLVELDERRDPQALAAARVSLGSLGVATQYTLRVVPAYALERKVWLRPVDRLLEEAPALAASYRHFELFVLPFTGYAAAVAHSPYAGSDVVTPRPADDTVLADLKRLRDWLGRFPVLRSWAAQRLIDPQQTEHARDRGYRLLSTTRSVRFNETEWHLPAERGLDGLRAVIAEIERHHDAFFPIEMRWVRRDEAWLSPFHGRDTCSIAIHAAADEEHETIVREGSRICLSHGGRPHWGKLHTLGATELAALYPRWADFGRVRREFDPQGRFLNAHLRQVFGLA